MAAILQEQTPLKPEVIVGVIIAPQSTVQPSLTNYLRAVEPARPDTAAYMQQRVCSVVQKWATLLHIKTSHRWYTCVVVTRYSDAVRVCLVPVIGLVLLYLASQDAHAQCRPPFYNTNIAKRVLSTTGPRANARHLPHLLDSFSIKYTCCSSRP